MRAIFLLSLLNIFSLPTQGFSGGAFDGGGGGNAHPSSSMSIQEIEEIVQDANFYLLPALHFHELIAKEYTPIPADLKQTFFHGTDISAAHLNSAYKKLFPEKGGADAFSALKSIKFFLKKDGPCLDLNNQERDAAAFIQRISAACVSPEQVPEKLKAGETKAFSPVREIERFLNKEKDFLHQDHATYSFNQYTNEVCISAERILPKLKRGDGFKVLVSLLGHELAHRSGADEHEAHAFQLAIQHTLAPGTKGDFLKAYSLVRPPKMREDFRSLEEKLTEDELDLMQACVKISLFESQMNALRSGVLREGLNQGFSAYNYAMLTHLNAATWQYEQIVNFCKEESPEKNAKSGPKDAPILVTERQQKRIAQESEKLKGTKNRIGPITKLSAEHGWAQYNPYLDEKALRFNFEEFRKNFSVVLDAPDGITEKRFPWIEKESH